MTPSEFFSAYIAEILKTHDSILEGESISERQVRDRHQDNLWEVIDHLFSRNNTPDIVTDLYDDSYDLIKELVESNSPGSPIAMNDLIADKLIALVYERARLYRIPLPGEQEQPPFTKEEEPKEDARNEKIKQLEKTLMKLVKNVNQGQFPKFSNSTRRGGRRHLSESVAEKKFDSLSFKMEDLLKADPKLKEKLEKFLEKNKAGYFYIPSLKRKVYISRTNLNKLKAEMNEKHGGFLPLIPILAAIAAAGSVAGGAAGIASAVNKKKAEDASLAEQHRHNISLEEAALGKGLKDDVVKFVQDNDIDDDLKHVVKKTLTDLATVIPMRKEGGSQSD